ncbi:MAG: DUF2155 domain-containing protein [Alphaproteobacteria bacterium]
MTISKWIAALCAAKILMFAVAPSAYAEDPIEDMAILERLDALRRIAVLRAVDKITAKRTDLEVETGEIVRFGTLEIVVRTCHKRPPEETPEVTAFLEVTDFPPQYEPRQIFEGWMFASSPAVSALEHAVYDVWVIDCKALAPLAEDPSAKKSP